MKKILLATTLTGVLLLGACGNDESEKKEDFKKSESVEKKKETPKKSEDKKDTDKQDTAQETKATQEPATQESVEQPVTKEETAPVEQQEEPNMPELDPEKNFDPHGGEIPNEGYSDEELKALEGGTDAGSTDKMEEFYQQERAKDLAKEDEAEPSEWVKGQDEWNNASESERVEMQKESARENGVEYDPKDFEVE